MFTKRSFFCTILGFFQSYSAPLVHIEGFIQFIPGAYKSDRPTNFTAIDKVHLKCDCNNGSFVNGIREPVLYSFALDKPPSRKIYNDPRLKRSEK